MKLKAGIIGLGVGESHVEGFNAHPDCTVTHLCDFSKEKLDSARKKYPELSVTVNASELLQNPDIDLISIASYDNFHFEQALQALNMGKHVFIEKPVCLFQDEAHKLQDILHKNPQLRMSSNLILRKAPRYQKLRQLLREQKFGKLFYIEGDYLYGRLHKITEGWRGDLDFYSVVYGGAVHLVDLILWLTGDRVVEVQALGNQIASEGTKFRFPDFVAALLRFESGMIAKVTANFGCVIPHFHNLSVFGTKATFLNRPEEGLLYTSRDPDVQPEKILEPCRGIAKGALLYNFVDSVIHNSPAEVTEEDIFTTMAVCFAIEKAIQSGKPQPVKNFQESV